MRNKKNMKYFGKYFVCLKILLIFATTKIPRKMKKRVTSIGMPVKRERFQPFIVVAVSAGIPMFVFNIKE